MLIHTQSDGAYLVMNFGHHSSDQTQTSRKSRQPIMVTLPKKPLHSPESRLASIGQALKQKIWDGVLECINNGWFSGMI
jgi:hypothetical protein